MYPFIIIQIQFCKTLYQTITSLCRTSMESNQITMLNNIDVRVAEFTINIRIIRLWRKKSHQNLNLTYSIEMIVIDEEGTRMHFNCLSKFFSRFETFLKEGACVKVTCPKVIKNNNTFKYVSNPHRLTMHYNTKIVRSVKTFGTCYGFSFTDFKSINDRTAPETHTIDIIGSIIKIHEKNTSEKNGKQYERRTVELQDLEDNIIYMTLWDNYENQLIKYTSNVPTGTKIIVILQFGKLQWFGGKNNVNTTYDITRLLINDDIQEISTFKNRLLDKQQNQNSSGLGRPSSTLFYSLHDDFLVDHVFKKATEVNQVREPKPVIIIGTIAYVEEHTGWYYEGCTTCTKKVYIKSPNNNEANADGEQKVEWKCINTDCPAEYVTPTPRLKIEMRVEDASGIISITLFGREAQRIFKKTPKEFVESGV
ncbi:hypothetical protein QVD17_19702 [Tagetes erecta]|uniref:Uncharacterized protein n=1 Tax=Tagetes erecta TaxID=13708 RepID=A0AAD8KMS6_TARER|nr:hypothetical protein QVD17_19702 [Tagetes erecta]